MANLPARSASPELHKIILADDDDDRDSRERLSSISRASAAVSTGSNPVFGSTLQPQVMTVTIFATVTASPSNVGAASTAPPVTVTITATETKTVMATVTSLGASVGGSSVSSSSLRDITSTIGGVTPTPVANQNPAATNTTAVTATAQASAAGTFVGVLGASAGVAVAGIFAIVVWSRKRQQRKKEEAQQQGMSQFRS